VVTQCTWLQADLVYLNYGTWNDFESAASSLDLEGKVALVRSGVISLQQKVCSFVSLLSLKLMLKQMLN